MIITQFNIAIVAPYHNRGAPTEPHNRGALTERQNRGALTERLNRGALAGHDRGAQTGCCTRNHRAW